MFSLNQLFTNQKFLGVKFPKPNKSGQILVIIVMVMLFSLTLGLSISTRFFKRISQLGKTDSAGRALGVAEAAVEHLLLKDNTTLESYITNNNCGSNCILTITGSEGISASAQVKLSYLGNSTAPYNVKVTKISVGEVNLQGYPNNTNLNVCWNTPSGVKPSIFANYIYGSGSSNYNADSYAYNSVGSAYSDNGFSNASANFGYTNCFTVIGKSNPAVLRLKTIYNDVTLYVLPTTGISLPSQGILLESVGTSADTKKTVRVYKTSSIAPPQFDYVLYQKSASDPLSN